MGVFGCQDRSLLLEMTHNNMSYMSEKEEGILMWSIARQILTLVH